MWVEIFALAVIVSFFIALVIFRKNPFVQMYWKYSLILLPFVIFLVLKIISDLSRPRENTGGTAQPSGSGLEGKVTELREQMTDIQIETAAAVAVAKTKDEELIKRLEAAKKITDRDARRHALINING